MYRALKSFAGKLTMRKNEVKEITNKAIVKDLIEAGYIEEIKSEKPADIKEEVKKEIKAIVSKKPTVGKKKK